MLSRVKLDQSFGKIVLKYSPPFFKIAEKSMGWARPVSTEVRPFLPPLTGVIEPRTKNVLDLVNSSKSCSILNAQRIQACAMRFYKM